MQSMVCLRDFEEYARKTLPHHAVVYYMSGAGDEVTLQENVNAYKRWKLCPRVLRGVSTIDMKTTILGYKMAFPVAIAPTGIHKMAHREGEVATAKAAYDMSTCFILAAPTTSTIEEVAEATPDSLRFFQTYIYESKELTIQLIKRAERNGYKAIVLTVDAPVVGDRRSFKKYNFQIPSNLKLCNLNESYAESDNWVYSGIEGHASLFNTYFTWDNIKWLKEMTTLPLILKGILSAADALKAVECGVDGIIVSNHGARQLDTVLPTIDALPQVVSAVNGKCEVYMDGGIRSGTDVFKALALGAKAVFIGRPALYGLAYNGCDGVKQVLSILKEDFSRAMILTGCHRIEDINKEFVSNEYCYQSKL